MADGVLKKGVDSGALTFLLCREIPGESLHRVRWGKQVWILGRLHYTYTPNLSSVFIRLRQCGDHVLITKRQWMRQTITL